MIKDVELSSPSKHRVPVANSTLQQLRAQDLREIRVLGKEIAEKLGTIGYLISLVRTSVGDYHIEDSKTIDQFKMEWKSYVH